MSILLAISNPDEAKTEEVRQMFLSMQSEHRVDIGDAMVLRTSHAQSKKQAQRNALAAHISMAPAQEAAAS